VSRTQRRCEYRLDGAGGERRLSAAHHWHSTPRTPVDSRSPGQPSPAAAATSPAGARYPAALLDRALL